MLPAILAAGFLLRRDTMRQGLCWKIFEKAGKAPISKKDGKVYNQRLTAHKRSGSIRNRLRITVDPLLPLVMILMAWVLSERYFPQLMYTQATWVYWAMGIVSSLFLTLSIFFHEYGHALTARFLKLPVERIHLYLFGGMAELRQRPVRPAEELIIAIAGPLASLLFSGIAWSLSEITHHDHNEVYLVLQFVFYMNVLLAGFNLLPIFPLDGGRAMRAILWYSRSYYYQASLITYYISIGIIMGLLLVALVLLVTEGFFTAFWVAIFGGYLWYTAYQGRDELIHQPDFEDLLFRIKDKRSPASIIRQINRIDAQYVTNAIIPVSHQGALESVVLGKDLKRIPEEDESLTHLYRPVEKGYFVDIDDESTYKPGVNLKAELLPVMKDGVVIGLSDANEIRFWLLQNKERFSTTTDTDNQ